MVPHCPPALVPSSASTTSGSPFSRPSLGTWCFIPCYPLFFVGKHHVRLPIFPTESGDVVLHPSLTLVPSSASTTSSTPKCRAAPGAWCLTALQPLFLRPQAPRLPLQSAGQPRGRGASSLASPCSFVGRHHVLRSKVPGSPEAWCLTALQPLFLRPQAPRQAAQALGRLRMRPDIAKSRFFSINVY